MSSIFNEIGIFISFERLNIIHVRPHQIYSLVFGVSFFLLERASEILFLKNISQPSGGTNDIVFFFFSFFAIVRSDRWTQSHLGITIWCKATWHFLYCFVITFLDVSSVHHYIRGRELVALLAPMYVHNLCCVLKLFCSLLCARKGGIRVENRYSALELLCKECDEIDCSNASHDSSIQASISYFDSDIACPDYHARLHPEHKGLHVANVNICHIKPKLDEIKLLLNSSSKLDILALWETFLDKNTDDNILKMEGFNFECKNRAAPRQDALNTKRGGGVVLYILVTTLNISVEMTSNPQKLNQFGLEST